MEHIIQTLSEEKANNDVSITLTVSEVFWLVNHMGLVIGDPSPLKKPLDLQYGDVERSSLAAKGLLNVSGQVTEIVAKSIATVANPGCELVVDVGNAALFNFMRLYFGSQQSVVSFTPLDVSTYKLVPELQLEDILVTILEGLNLDSEIVENPLSFDLSQKGLLALAALIDAIRQNQLRSLLNRNDNEGVMVDFLEIWACIKHGLLEDDFRWLTAVIRSRLPDEINVEQVTLSEGLQEIESVGIAVRGDSTWSLNEHYIGVITELMTPLNFGSIFAQALSGTETINLFLIRCPAALFAVNFGPNGKASLFTFSVDRLGMIVAELMAKLIVIGSAASKPADIDRVPASTYQTTDVAFNTDAGYPGQITVKNEPVRFCGQCGQETVTPDLKYCQNCGSQLSFETEKAIPNSTPSEVYLQPQLAEIAKRYESLKTQYDSGILDHASFLEGINSLRFQDSSGNWWQLKEDGQSWLRWDGAAWVVVAD